MSDPRERRDELLLDLGALVYELHRLRRRAPDLLSAKAVELDELDAQLRPADPADIFCTTCGTAAGDDQLVCLACGSRIALAAGQLLEPAWDQAEIRVEDARHGGAVRNTVVVESYLKEPPAPAPAPVAIEAEEVPDDVGDGESWPPDTGDLPAAEAPDEPSSSRSTRLRRAAAAGAVALGVAAATLGALLAVAGGTRESSRHASKDSSEVLSTPARPAPTPVPEPARTPDGLVAWRGGRGYTVVLLTTGDLASARITARRLNHDGVDAGVVHNGRFWLVFSGRYHDAAVAQPTADLLRQRLGAAYVQLVAPRPG